MITSFRAFGRGLKQSFAAFTALALLFAASGRCEAIVNGDFSADGWQDGTLVPDLRESPDHLTYITGWTIAPGSRIIGFGPGFASIPTSGIEFTGWTDSVAPSGVSQKLDTKAGISYSVSFDIYDIGASPSNIDVVLNGQPLGSNLGAQEGSVVDGTTKVQTFTYPFVGTGSDEIAFLWAGPAGSATTSILSNVRVTPGGVWFGGSSSGWLWAVALLFGLVALALVVRKVRAA